MKRLLIAVAVLASALLILGVIGWQRGKTCPPFVGYACYELSHGEEPAQIMQFIEYATQHSGHIHFDQKRWPGSETAEQATRAYRASLRYFISQEQPHPHLHIWCVASTGETAVDGPVFPGELFSSPKFGGPSMQLKGLLVSHAAQMTDLQKMLFGLGMYPPGEPLSLKPVL